MEPHKTVVNNVDEFQLAHIINTFFEQKIHDSEMIHPHYGELWSELHRLILSGGKRLRPKVTMLAYRAYGGTDSVAIIPIAFAQELLHLALLIHDDIIDYDYKRYGVKNIAGSYIDRYDVLSPDERCHYANAAAMLGGDLLLSSAYEVINKSTIDLHLKARSSSLLSKSIFLVGGGELLDSESAFRDHGENSELIIAQYKTASYTFTGPLLTGAVLASAPDEQIRLLEDLAVHIGIAYQLTDDLLGVFGDETMTGKTTLGDIRDGKKTYLVRQFYAVASNKDKAIFNTYFGDKTIKEKELEIIKNLFVSSGAQQLTYDKIKKLQMRAIAIVAELSIDAAYKKQFITLINTAVQRSM